MKRYNVGDVVKYNDCDTVQKVYRGRSMIIKDVVSRPGTLMYTGTMIDDQIDTYIYPHEIFEICECPEYFKELI